MMRGRYDLTTKNGYPLDEVVSAIQKSIRRGLEEEAAYWALELADSGMGQYLWRRLMVIAFEDIALGDPEVVRLVVAGWLATKEATKTWAEMRHEMLGTVILAMCRAKKCREGDDFLWYVMTRREHGEKREIPDYALDEHTARGRSMGRGRAFWFEEASRFETPDTPGPDYYGKAVQALFEDLEATGQAAR